MYHVFLNGHIICPHVIDAIMISKYYFIAEIRITNENTLLSGNFQI